MKQMTARQQDLIRTACRVKRTWRAACEHDGIDADAKFVVLSPDNPHQAEYNEAMQRLQALRRYEKVYHVFARCTREEWGNGVMEQIAKDAIEDPTLATKRPLLVTVQEHAGWWLRWLAEPDQEPIIVGSANETAIYTGRAKLFRETCSEVEFLPNYERGRRMDPELARARKDLLDTVKELVA